MANLSEHDVLRACSQTSPPPFSRGSSLCSEQPLVMRPSQPLTCSTCRLIPSSCATAVNPAFEGPAPCPPQAPHSPNAASMSAVPAWQPCQPLPGPSHTTHHTTGPATGRRWGPCPSLRGWALPTRGRVGDRRWHPATHVRRIAVALIACHRRPCLWNL